MTEQIVINDPVQEKSLEESAAEMGLLEDSQAPESAPAAEERPEWLPEKFSSPEAMAKAYGELEARLSRSPAEQQQQQAEQAQEAPSEAEAREVTQAAGIDFDILTQEYMDNQGLTQESYDKLGEAGIPRHIVDQFIAGQEASAEMQRGSIIEEAGGESEYSNMVNWAAETFSEEEITAFNNTVTQGDTASVRMAVAGLKARFEASQGNEPQRMVSGESAGANVYRSNAELVSDMSDPRYHSDPAFRADVMKKLERSDIM